MQLVIADTGPINYLILIGQIDLLPRMFKRVILPSAVQLELTSPMAPAAEQGLRVTGTLGVLDLAADLGLVDFALAIRDLESTNFRRPQALLKVLLEKPR